MDGTSVAHDNALVRELFHVPTTASKLASTSCLASSLRFSLQSSSSLALTATTLLASECPPKSFGRFTGRVSDISAIRRCSSFKLQVRGHQADRFLKPDGVAPKDRRRTQAVLGPSSSVRFVPTSTRCVSERPSFHNISGHWHRLRYLRGR